MSFFLGGGGGHGACLLSSFLLFRTQFVRNVMVILKHMFHKYFDLVWGLRGFLVLGLSVYEWHLLHWP